MIPCPPDYPRYTYGYIAGELHNEDLIVCEGRILVYMPRVLVIDDAEYARDILKKILISGGYEIAGEAGDGEAGVTEFSRTNPDIVIIDMIMPKMNGVEAIKAIKTIEARRKNYCDIRGRAGCPYRGGSKGRGTELHQ